MARYVGKTKKETAELAAQHAQIRAFMCSIEHLEDHVFVEYIKKLPRYGLACYCNIKTTHVFPDEDGYDTAYCLVCGGEPGLDDLVK